MAALGEPLCQLGREVIRLAAAADPTHHFLSSDDFGESLRDAACPRFHFDVEQRAGEGSENLLERRDPYAFAPERKGYAAIRRESAPRIPFCELRKSEIGDRSGSVRTSVNRRIVRDHDHAIARLMNIELQHVDVILADRDFECGEGVFGRQQASAPVRDVQGGREPAKERMEHCYLPEKLGARFSLYARIPSAAS